jgi:hypothetical protein
MPFPMGTHLGSETFPQNGNIGKGKAIPKGLPDVLLGVSKN